MGEEYILLLHADQMEDLRQEIRREEQAIARKQKRIRREQRSKARKFPVITTT